MAVSLTDRIRSELPNDIEEPPSRARDTILKFSSTEIFQLKSQGFYPLAMVCCTRSQDSAEFNRDLRVTGIDLARYDLDSCIYVQCIRETAHGKFWVYAKQKPFVPR